MLHFTHGVFMFQFHEFMNHWLNKSSVYRLNDLNCCHSFPMFCWQQVKYFVSLAAVWVLVSAFCHDHLINHVKENFCSWQHATLMCKYSDWTWIPTKPFWKSVFPRVSYSNMLITQSLSLKWGNRRVNSIDLDHECRVRRLLSQVLLCCW